MNHKLELMDQFDDAAFALMMDEYAEAEGERLRAEFEEAMRSGTAPACPPELDEKCRKQIKRHFGKQRRSAYAGLTRRVAAIGQAFVQIAGCVDLSVGMAGCLSGIMMGVACGWWGWGLVPCLLIALGISATLIMSVEALRVPFWKFIMEEYGSSTVFDFSGMNEENQGVYIDPLEMEDPVKFYLPEGYHNVSFEEDQGRINSVYETDDGRFVAFEMIHSDSNLLNTVQSAYDFERFELVCYEAQYSLCYYTDEGWPMEMVEWYDPEIETMYCVAAKGMGKMDLIEICESLAKCFAGLTIEQQVVVPNALEGKLSKNYELIYDNTIPGWPNFLYRDDTADKIVYFSALEMTGTMDTFIQDPVITDAVIGGFEATHMIGNDEIGTIWFDLERNVRFYFVTNDFTDEDHLSLCEYLAEYYKGVTLPAVSTVIWD